MKEFGLHFRHRNENGIHDVGVVCQAKSKKDATRTGRNLERPNDKVFFMRLIPAEVARNTGGRLP